MADLVLGKQSRIGRSAGSGAVSTRAAQLASSEKQNSGVSLSMAEALEEWGGAPTTPLPFEPKAASLINDAIRQADSDASGGATAGNLNESVSSASTDAGSANGAKEPVTSKPAVNGQPPELMEGEDDIYW